MVPLQLNVVALIAPKVRPAIAQGEALGNKHAAMRSPNGASFRNRSIIVRNAAPLGLGIGFVESRGFAPGYFRSRLRCEQIAVLGESWPSRVLRRQGAVCNSLEDWGAKRYDVSFGASPKYFNS